MPFKLEGAIDSAAPPASGVPEISNKFKLAGASDAVPVKPEQSFSQRVGEDIAKRQATEKKDVFKEDQSPISAGLQGVGQYMAMGSDVAGEVGKSAINAIPESIKRPIASAASKAGNYLANTDIGKAGIAKAVEAKQALSSLAQAHPEAARNIGAVGNIASAFPAGLGAGAAEKAALTAGEKIAPTLEKAGAAATKAGEKQVAERETKNFVDLVSPKESKKVKEANVSNTVEKGRFLQKKEVIPDKFTTDVAKTVSTVPGVNPKKSFQHNYNAIAAENKAEAQKLEGMLKSSNVVIPTTDINKAAADVRASLAKQTFLVGDAKKVSDKMIAEAGSLIKKNGNTAAGLLKSRQEFDAWAKGQMGGDPFSDSNKARGASLKAVRHSLNNLIADAVPSAGVKDSLKKQYHLYTALDNITPKAASEGKSAISRAAAKLGHALPVHNPYAKGGAGLAGMGAILNPALAGSAIAHAAPYAAVAVPAYGIYKGVTSPGLKKTIGTSLIKMSDVLKP